MNQFLRKAALQFLLACQRDGNQTLGVYNDKRNPTLAFGTESGVEIRDPTPLQCGRESAWPYSIWRFISFSRADLPQIAGPKT